MKTVFVFPGQGSQTVGMGRALCDAFGEARAVFDEVDEALGEKLSATMWEGPEDRLRLTANAQPALMTTSLAAMRVLQARGLDLKRSVAYVAGHSLGEFSALAAAGALSIGDAARLLRLRGEAMQAAVPAGEGAMAAVIGLDEEAVAGLCAESAGDEICEIANDNGGGQIVVSGAAAAVARAIALARDRGAKRAIELPVSAPFHCKLMQPAAERLAAALAETKIGEPAVPVVANVLARPIANPAEIRNRLVEQVTGRVRWRETIEYLNGEGVGRYFEIGTGKVLSGLVKRIDRSAETMPVGEPADIDKALAALS